MPDRRVPGLVVPRGGATFRNHIVNGIGGKQILVEDPSGNVVELFEPHR
jgi:hypothetical protein